MRFRIQQRFDAPVEEVEAVLLDPAFLVRLGQLPKLGRPELLDQREDGDVVHRRVRFAFAGQLSAAVTAVVDPARLTWVEELEELRSHLPEDHGVLVDVGVEVGQLRFAVGIGPTILGPQVGAHDPLSRR